MAVQINVRVSESTKALLERESRATGIKKEALVEEALLYHFQALHELPADIMIKPRLVVTAEAANVMSHQMNAPQPTPALRTLMKQHGD
jgi:hypothetical protein